MYCWTCQEKTEPIGGLLSSTGATGKERIVSIINNILRVVRLFEKASNQRQQVFRAQNEPRRAAFKVRYELNMRQPISQFEEKLLVGMSRENNEVWAAAFCNDREVLKVTANVGSRYKSRPTDKVNDWPRVARQIGATQIRVYHSHPPGIFCSAFSALDRETYGNLKLFLGQNRIQFQGYLVYAAFLGSGYRIKPFFGE